MEYEIWLQAVLLEGSNKVIRVLKYFGSAEKVYKAGKAALESSAIFSPAELERAAKITIKYSKDIIKTCRKNKIDIITISSSRYPKSLWNIENPPLVLYTKGEFPDFSDKPSICIVGPREISEFGKKSAFSIAYRLSRAGFTVVSGGAKGGDRAAHLGVLKAEGKPISILPCGILNPYLLENEKLRQTIAKTGCLLSECPPEKGVNRASFKVRNRLLAALTLGTVVVEAGEPSGVLITANYACNYGKDLFVIPGNPTYPQYKGSNKLIRDGAKPLLDVFDIFNEYIGTFGDRIDTEKAMQKTEVKEKTKKIIKNLPLTLSKEAKMLYNQLDKQKFSADDLLSLGISDDLLISAITELEMERLIKSLPGGFYEKI
ncbi:MAG: DNA-processing protein DprA [Oscillospiraceae bacterium]|nr:DNA-processing protein DprA [Oscillospiraceae bacterium]